MIDIILLRIMQSRDDHSRLRPLVQEGSLTPETNALLKDIDRYFQAYPSHNQLDITTFMTNFPKWHPGITDDRIREFAKIMGNVLKEQADEDQKSNIIAWLADEHVSVQIKNLLAEYDEGDLDNLPFALGELFDSYRRNRGIKQLKHIDIPIRELLKEDTNNEGIKWRLRCLNESTRPLRGGDFGIVAARPDQGKTSFLASELSFMAPQLPEEKNVLWLNNEGHGKRIIPRVWQAALNLTIREMVELDRADRLEEMYLAVMKRFDKIRVIDIHGLNNAQVEIAIEANNPGIVVYDMIDNIGGFGDAARTDLKLEYMYQWARDRSVKYDAIGMATSQISSDGHGLRFPGLSMLKDSKTGKQGACDFQLMIGSVEDPMMKMARFMGLPKNKLRLPDGPASPDKEVTFDALRARFVDLDIDPNIGV